MMPSGVCWVGKYELDSPSHENHNSPIASFGEETWTLDLRISLGRRI